MSDEVKKEILMMYELVGDNDLKYYEAIQNIIDYIAELENETYKLTELWNKEVDKRRKAIEYIKEWWYEKNTTDIEHVISLGDKRIDLFNILNGRSDE